MKKDYIFNNKQFLINLGVTIILLICVLNLVIHKNITLSCGLFAFIGTNPDKYFSWDKFNILGWFNDTRGGDACGRVVGNLCQHGIEKLKTYKEFAMSVKNPTDVIIDNVVLGHCRKASSGGTLSMYAQPIVLRKRDVNLKAIKSTNIKKIIKQLDDNDIVCSGIHNGTIDNYMELAPQYGIPTEDHNDTKVLLTALFYGNYDILTKYVGTAALVWHNNITKESYIFKGESKFSNSSINIIEERPLYCWIIDSENIYVSSIQDSLLFIGAVPDKVINIKTNTLFTFKNGIKISTEKFDRSEKIQNKFTSVSSNSAYRGNSVFRHRDFYFNDVIEENYENCKVPARISDVKLETKQKKIKGFVGTEDEQNPYVRLFKSTDIPFRLQSEISDSKYSKFIRKVFYNKGRYWMNGCLMHGTYLLNSIGLVPTKIIQDISVLKAYYFIEGIMMDGITSFNKVLPIHTNLIKICEDDISNLMRFEQDFTSDISRYSKYPVVSLTKTTKEQDCFSCMAPKKEILFFTGSFSPLFSDKKYTFENGDLKDIELEAVNGIRTAIHSNEDNGLANTYIIQCRMHPNLNNSPEFTIGYRLLEDDTLQNKFSPLQKIILSTIDLTDEIDLRVMLIHYLRDFRSKVESQCILCTNEKTTLTYTCTSCRFCKDEITALSIEADYERYNI